MFELKNGSFYLMISKLKSLSTNEPRAPWARWERMDGPCSWYTATSLLCLKEKGTLS